MDFSEKLKLLLLKIRSALEQRLVWALLSESKTENLANLFEMLRLFKIIRLSEIFGEKNLFAFSP